ncbi:unnamed protein product [Mytilus coruscus]|uniref:Integrase zinc-binding domain-containing protein n=1 Tax=Mytilus coruscus TaxID=42192 RepID=A0A6J8BG44_MYTCO|nr:unnamed protein product [Mytilus coruscus]
MQEEADRELSRMFDAGAGLKISPKKCELLQEKVTFLGHVVSGDGISTDPEKISAVKDWPIPLSIHDDSKENTNNDLDTVDCHLRVTKKADISKLQGEEIEFNNSEQSNKCVQSKNTDEITEAQQDDEVIKLIWKMKSESNEKPKWEEISVQSKELKTCWSQWDQLKLIDNVLYREWISNINPEMKQLILPSCWREDILKMLHDDQVEGHLGIHRTLSRVSTRFYWAEYKENIEQWCKRSEICNSRKGPQKKRARGAMKQYLVGARLERVALDILVPLPITSSGKKFILVLTDYFSRWAEAYPIPNQEAETIS